VGDLKIRRAATGARAGWAGREAEAQWEEGGRPVGKPGGHGWAGWPLGRLGRK
jgi:hypothetical protein